MLWILSIVGTLGIAGFVALMFFAPAAALIVADVVRSMLRGLVAFAKTRVGGVVLALVLGLAIGGALGYAKGRSRLTALNAAWQQKVDEAAEKFAQARRDRDRAVEEAVARAQGERQRALAAQELKLLTKFNEWAKGRRVRCKIREEDFK